MDSVASWLLLDVLAFMGMWFFIKTIAAELDQKHKDSEDAWREWEREYF